MLGFHAEHESGEIAVDGVEIEHAAWFRRDALPEIPSKGTVARRIIDRWLGGEL
jgi:NAD+ diphosphatase